VATTRGWAISRRLLGKHVERRTADPARLESVVERALVHDPATGTVDQKRPRAHRRELVRAEQASCLGREGCVQGDDVGSPEQLLETERLDPDPRRDSWSEEGVVGDDLHLERARPGGDLLADPAQPDDAQGFAAELGPDEALPVPLALLQRPVGGGHVARERQQQGERVLDGGEQIGPRNVEHEDAPSGRGVQVDVVDPDTGAPDDPEARRLVEHGGVHLGSASNQEGVRPAKC